MQIEKRLRGPRMNATKRDDVKMRGTNEKKNEEKHCFVHATRPFSRTFQIVGRVRACLPAGAAGSNKVKGIS
jgi:hypothetical protein